MQKKELTWRIRVYGIVQGVGFRPTVSRHAAASGIRGTVCNKGPYVEIYTQGEKEQIEGFLKALEVHPPKRAAILPGHRRSPAHCGKRRAGSRWH